MKLFEKILMASEDVKSYLVSGKCEKELFDGAVVKVGDLVDHDVYKGLKDMNTRTIEAGYEAGKRYGIVDYVGVSESDVVGVNYKGLSIKVAGLPVPAGALTRVRVPQIGDEFFLGDENFTSAPTAGSVYVPDTDGRFKAGAEGAGFAVKVEYETNKIMGQVNDSKKYFCTVLSI